VCVRGSVPVASSDSHQPDDKQGDTRRAWEETRRVLFSSLEELIRAGKRLMLTADLIEEINRSSLKRGRPDITCCDHSASRASGPEKRGGLNLNTKFQKSVKSASAL
jgi:hypothetical protein